VNNAAIFSQRFRVQATRERPPAGLLAGFKARPHLRRTPQILKKILFALLPD